LLSNKAHWHSHGRHIGIRTLKEACKLHIDDYGQIEELQRAIRAYSDTLSDWLARGQIKVFLFNRHVSPGFVS